MRILIELSGEQTSLARAEALAALEASGRPFRVLLAEDRLLAAETDVDAGWLARRLGLAHYVDELLAWGPLDAVLVAARGLSFPDRTFRVRVNSFKGCHNKQELERQIGDLIVAREVNLRNPDEEVRLIEGEQHYLCRRLAAIDRSAYESRKVEERSFFYPISLHPRLARALVNLGRVREGDVVLDPFCGTGGVLLEAGLIGARVIGSDIREDMVEGCREVLGRWGLTADLAAMDIGKVPEYVGRVDAVVTDPPYGRATTTKGEPLGSLFARALAVARDVLKPGRFLSMIVPDPKLVKSTEGLELVESYSLRVHKSLTRTFVVIRRAGGTSVLVGRTPEGPPPSRAP
ncbi:MAG: methyltransferase domain-containing protein [Euryarchaeota archaeon]|nr:methyltransferase domain-containing protein [Euryarchaeota archaeon]